MEASAAATDDVLGDDDVGCELIADADAALLFAEQETKPSAIGRHRYRTFIPAAVIGKTLPSESNVMGNPFSGQGSSCGEIDVVDFRTSAEIGVRLSM